MENPELGVDQLRARISPAGGRGMGREGADRVCQNECQTRIKDFTWYLVDGDVCQEHVRSVSKECVSHDSKQGMIQLVDEKHPLRVGQFSAQLSPVRRVWYGARGVQKVSWGVCQSQFTEVVRLVSGSPDQVQHGAWF